MRNHAVCLSLSRCQASVRSDVSLRLEVPEYALYMESKRNWFTD